MHSFHLAYIPNKFFTDLKVYLWVGSCFCDMVYFIYKLVLPQTFETFQKSTIKRAFVKIFKN